MTLSRIALMGGPVYDSDAKAYFAALANTGVAPSFQQKRAINTFIRTEKAAGRFTSIKRLYLPIWGVAAANAIDIVSRASGTFSGGMTHASGYVQGDGSTGYFTTGATIGTSTNSTSVFALKTTKDGRAGTRFVFGHAGGANWASIMEFAGEIFFRVNSGSSETTADTTALGIYIASRTASNSCFLLKRTSSGTATVAGVNNSVALATNNGFAAAINGTSDFSNARLGFFGEGFGFSETDAEALTLSLKTLWETCTGLTIP